MDDPLILGIHGFARKPDPRRLLLGWRRAVEEGLRRNCGLGKKDGPARPRFELDLAYWADRVHEPLEEDPEPYHPAPGNGPLPHYDDNWVDELVADVIDLGESLVDLAMLSRSLHQKTGWLLERFSRDCERYNGDPELQAAIRGQLATKLVDGVEKGRKILLIGHSMGSVIAYEVLRELEGRFREPVVEHLISIGSPLGFSFLTRDLELRHGPNRVPNTVRRWSNLTDRRDWAAIDAHLGDDYKPSSRGVRVEDDLVVNTYLCPLKRPNTHKAYGYLRAPEVSERIRDFLLP